MQSRLLWDHRPPCTTAMVQLENFIPYPLDLALSPKDINNTDDGPSNAEKMDSKHVKEIGTDALACDL